VPDDTTALTRRDLLQRAGGLAAVGVPLLLEACAPAAPAAPTNTTKPNATSAPVGVTLSAYLPFQGQSQPDLPGNANGLDPAYFSFPSQLTQTVPQTPGDGSDVSAIVVLTYSPPPGPDQNAAWQAINKQLGVNLKVQMVPSADYAATVNTVLAGSDIPDFIYNATTTQPLGNIPAIVQFANTRCADLTPYLGGDAIKDYPNLANFSTYTWRSGVVGGKLYAIPSARAPIGTTIAYRKDLFDQAGVQMENAPKNADDFKRILQQLTRSDQNQWGIATAGTATFGLNSGSPFLGIFRVPNNWKLDSSGKLVKDFETGEFKAAVGFARDLWSAGVYHPNTPSYGGTGNPDYAGGRFAVQIGRQLLRRTVRIAGVAAELLRCQRCRLQVRRLWHSSSDRPGSCGIDRDVAIHHVAALRAVRHGPIAGVRNRHACSGGGHARGRPVRSDAWTPVRLRVSARNSGADHTVCGRARHCSQPPATRRPGQPCRRLACLSG
jgi:ABC-type glycerol-3-phosphate transport system substrate-binding protein